jgi:hypothetical protein
MNPNLGPIEDIGLSFDKLRIVAVGLKVGSVAWANGELKTLNAIRNKLAHRLDVEITDKDIAPLRRDADELLKDSIVKDLLIARGRYPVYVIESWAIIFGTVLAVEQAMERHKNDTEAQKRELNAASAQLLRELFANGEGGV